MNIAAGLYAPEAGQLLVDDNIVRFAGPRDAAKHRIGMVHQHFKLVRPFTVAQNILLTAPPPADFQSHGERLREIARDIRNKASELGFDIDPSKRIDALSIAEQQRVEILKVLLAGARILILDEPTAVLTDQEAARLLQTVQGLARGGAAVVLVTHKMADVKTYADRVTVMRGGRTVATLAPGDTSVAELVKLTVGASIATQEGFQVAKSSRGPVRLSVRGLRSPASTQGRRVLDGIDLELHAGEIYGLAGVGGNGQGELADAIMGLPDVSGSLEGEIHLEGHGDLKAMTGPARRNVGIAAIPADRYGLALAGSLSVAENTPSAACTAAATAPSGICAEVVSRATHKRPCAPSTCRACALSHRRPRCSRAAMRRSWCWPASSASRRRSCLRTARAAGSTCAPVPRCMRACVPHATAAQQCC